MEIKALMLFSSTQAVIQSMVLLYLAVTFGILGPKLWKGLNSSPEVNLQFLLALSLRTTLCTFFLVFML